MFKKTWTKANGASPVIRAAQSALRWIEVDMASLLPGETLSYDGKGGESAVIVLGGTLSVKGEAFCFDSVGVRKNVFAGRASAVYVPADTPFAVRAETGAELCVCRAPSSLRGKPALIRPEDVVVKALGKPGWSREAHFILDERVEANMLYIGEAFVKGGQWASYPPHKHDVDNMPAEGVLEEAYYFEFSRPEGFGIQKVYAKDGSLDETYTVKTGDLVEIPRGYHPFCAAPGYDGYYLWIMAGTNRGFYMSLDDDHRRLNG